MCHPLVLAAAEPLPISEYAAKACDDEVGWITVRSSDHARCPDSQALFPNRSIYWVSARHTGDACGFSGSYVDANNAREELADFLDQSLARCEDLQLYVASTWFGKIGETPRRLCDLAPHDIRTWVTEFIPGDLYQLLQDA